MTTVAYRNGELAADTLGLAHGTPYKLQKLHRVNDGNDEYIIGFSGNAGDGLQFIKWWADRTKELSFIHYDGAEDEPTFTAFVLGPDSIEEWSPYLQPVPILDEFHAIGTGAQAALAAMHMGATAAEAVKIASLVDIHTGGEVASMKINASTALLI